MADTDVQLVGKELGQHGSNIYYREFSVRANGTVKNYKLGKFYVVQRNPSQPICIAEFQLIWKNIKDGRKLASAKLYFRPEDTPYGRQAEHGEDEVLEADRHVAIYCTEVPRWECDPQSWKAGHFAYEDVQPARSKQFIDITEESSEQPLSSLQSRPTRNVKILGYLGYCRYKACEKILQSDQILPKKLMVAKGAIELPCLNTRVLFSRCKFSHPSIEDHVFSGDLKLPVFKGRPRKRKGTSMPALFNSKGLKLGRLDRIKTTADGLSVTQSDLTQGQRFTLNGFSNATLQSKDKFEKASTTLDYEEDPDKFLAELQAFMKQLGSPITKIPKVAFTRVSLHQLFRLVNQYGGYAQVTMNHKWKRVYDAMGLATTITSAATCIRRHYERLLLPYEKYLRLKQRVLKEQGQEISACQNQSSSHGEDSDNKLFAAEHLNSDSRVDAQADYKSQGLINGNCGIHSVTSGINSHVGFRHVDVRPNETSHLSKSPKSDLNSFIENRAVEPSSQGVNTDDDDVPPLPLKLVIQRRRGRPPKYLKAKLEELKSLAQKAKIHQLCAQRTSKRGRKPKSTVLRLSVGPDGTIRSEIGNLQLSTEQSRDVLDVDTEISKDQQSTGQRKSSMIPQPALHITDKNRCPPVSLEALGKPSKRAFETSVVENGNLVSGDVMHVNGFRLNQGKHRTCPPSAIFGQHHCHADGSTVGSSPGVASIYRTSNESDRQIKTECSHGLVCLEPARDGQCMFKENTRDSLLCRNTPNASHDLSVITATQASDRMTSSGLDKARHHASEGWNFQTNKRGGDSGGHPPSGKKLGPPPLVPIENNILEGRCEMTKPGGRESGRESPSTVSISSPSNIPRPRAISLASVVPGLNIVAKPFDVDSLIKPLTKHIDQSLQTIKETVDAKISRVVYVGDEERFGNIDNAKGDVNKSCDSTEGSKRDKDSVSSERFVRKVKISGQDDCSQTTTSALCIKRKDATTGNRGFVPSQRQVLFIPKEQQKGYIIQSGNSFVSAAPIKLEKESVMSVGKVHYTIERSSVQGVTCASQPTSLSSYLHTSPYPFHRRLPVENSSRCAHLSNRPNTTVTPAVDLSGRQYSCNAAVAKSHHYHHHHPLHQSHYCQNHSRHYQAKEAGDIAAGREVAALLRKEQSVKHRGNTVSSSSSLADHGPMER